MGLTINSLSPVLGAEVVGLDLSSPISDAEFTELNQAWLDHNGVLVIRDQTLTPDEHIAFSKRLGELEVHVVGQFLLDGYPEVYRVSTKVDDDGRPMGNPESGRYWHSDLSYLERPSKASLLYALELPPSGGDTMLASMYAAYDSLSPTMKGMLDGLTAVHDLGHVGRLFSTGGPNQEQTAKTPPVEHPIVRTSSGNGKKGVVRQSGLHDAHRPIGEVGERGLARVPVRSRHEAGIRLPSQVAAERSFGVGQPLHGASRRPRLSRHRSSPHASDDRSRRGGPLGVGGTTSAEYQKRAPANCRTVGTPDGASAGFIPV